MAQGSTTVTTICTLATRATLRSARIQARRIVADFAQNFDYSRIDYMAQYLLPYALDGGAPALAHSQFHYLREIPLGRRYEVRTSVAGWDDKRVSAYRTT